MNKKLGTIFFLAAFCIANAQLKTTDIDSVEIQGKFIATTYKNANQNISIITKEDILNSPAVSIDEILQQIPGMDIRRRGANGVQSDVGFRGSSFEQVLILINGIRMNDSQTGHNSLNIPVDFFILFYFLNLRILVLMIPISFNNLINFEFWQK